MGVVGKGCFWRVAGGGKKEELYLPKRLQKLAMSAVSTSSPNDKQIQ